MADVDTSQEMTIADGLVIKWVDVINLKEQDLNAQVMEPRKFDALTQNCFVCCHTDQIDFR